MLETIGSRDIPIPQHIDIFHLKNEMEASDKTALECVMEVDEERMRLEAEAAELTKLGDEGSDRYGFVAKSNCFIRCLPNDPIEIYPCSKIERPNVKPWFVGVCVVFTEKRFCIIYSQSTFTLRSPLLWNIMPVKVHLKVHYLQMDDTDIYASSICIHLCTLQGFL